MAATDKKEQPDNQANGFEPLLDYWRDYIEQSSSQMDAMMAAFKGDPSDLRRMWLDSLSKNLDAYMRSPIFLESMRRNMETLTQLKSTGEDWARDFSRSTGIPRIPDISGLFERLQIGQDTILKRLDTIEKRLAEVESQVVQNGKKKKSKEN